MTLFAGLAYRKARFFGMGKGKRSGTRVSSLHQGNTELIQYQECS